MKNKIKKILLLIPPITFIISLLFGSLFYVAAIVLPTPIINESYVIKYLDSDGNELFTTHFNTEGSYIELSKISPYLIEGYVIIEDKNFYSHNGFDTGRIIKASLSNMLNKEIVEGGSTITQQLSRSLYLNNEKTYTRKLKELFYSARIEMNYSKEKINKHCYNSRKQTNFLTIIIVKSSFFSHIIYIIKRIKTTYTIQCIKCI